MFVVKQLSRHHHVDTGILILLACRDLLAVKDLSSLNQLDMGRRETCYITLHTCPSPTLEPLPPPSDSETGNGVSTSLRGCAGQITLPVIHVK